MVKRVINSLSIKILTYRKEPKGEEMGMTVRLRMIIKP